MNCVWLVVIPNVLLNRFAEINKTVLTFKIYSSSTETSVLCPQSVCYCSACGRQMAKAMQDIPLAKKSQKKTPEQACWLC